MLSRQTRPVDYSQPPSPCYILRGHLEPVTALAFSHSRTRFLSSGDASGVVALWDLESYRTRVVWKPHLDGILSLALLGPHTLVTHARDNKLHLFRLDRLLAAAKSRPSNFASPLTDSDALPPCLTLDVNALNFCRLSILEVPQTRNDESDGLISVPSLTKDDHVDIFHVPSKARLHRSLGISSLVIDGGNPDQKTGSVMATHLLYLPSSNRQSPLPRDSVARDGNISQPGDGTNRERRKTLHLLIGYESGQLALLEFTPTRNFVLPPTRPDLMSSSSSSSEDEHEVAFPAPGRMIEENEGWSLVWVEKCHRDAVMSIEVSNNSKFVYSVGADHLLVKYRLWDLNEEESQLPRTHVESTDSPGKSTIKARLANVSTNASPIVRGGGGGGGESAETKSKSAEILAVAGWNGDVRIYSGKSLQPLASLNHHRNSVQALDFAPISSSSSSSSSSSGLKDKSDSNSDSSDDEEEEGIAGERSRRGLLATGGTDTKICLWKIYPPPSPLSLA